MAEFLALVKDYGPVVNSLGLAAGLWLLNILRLDVKDIRDNHLPHIYERLGELTGRSK